MPDTYSRIYIQAGYLFPIAKRPAGKTSWPVIHARNLLKIIANQITGQTFWKY